LVARLVDRGKGKKGYSRLFDVDRRRPPRFGKVASGTNRCDAAPSEEVDHLQQRIVAGIDRVVVGQGKNVESRRDERLGIFGTCDDTKSRRRRVVRRPREYALTVAE